MSDKHHCTKESPMPPTAHKRDYWHNDAKCVDEEYNGLSGGGDYEIYQCPHCESRFYVELPD